MDIVFIRELRLPAWIGLYKHEKLAPQTIELDIEMGLPAPTVFATGKVRDTIDYAVVTARIRAILESERFGLVETLAEHLSKMILTEFHAASVRITVTKLGVLREAKRVGVVIERRAP